MTTFAKFDYLNAPELLTDGDMEIANTDDWTAGDSATLSKETGTPHGGARVLRVTNASAVGDARQVVFSAGLGYRVHGFARGDGTSVPSVKTYETTGWTGTSSTDWQEIDFFLQTPINPPLGVSAIAQWRLNDDLATTAVVDSVAGNFNGVLEENGVGVNTGIFSTAPTGHWKLNDDAANTTVVDSTGNNGGILMDTDANPLNTEDYTTAGKINKAIAFDATATTNVFVADTGGDTNFDYTDSYSIAFWVKTTSTNSDWSMSEHWEGGGGYPWAIRGLFSGGDLIFGLWDTTNNPFVSTILFGRLDDGVWHHIVFVKDRANLEIRSYVDGNWIATSTDTTDASTKSGSEGFRIGSRSQSSKHVTADIDDFRVYNFVLDQEQIDTIYNDDNGTEDATLGKINEAFILPGTRYYDTGIPGYVGDSYQVNVADDSVIKFAYDRNFSWGLWFKTSATAQSANNLSLGGYNFNCAFHFSSNGLPNLKLDAGTRNGAGDTIRAVTASTVTANDGVWHHAFMTYDLTTTILTFYLDGVSQGTVICDNTFDTTTEDFKIGNSTYGGNTQAFNGLLDDIRIYDSTLSALQIKAIFDEVSESEDLRTLKLTKDASGNYTEYDDVSITQTAFRDFTRGKVKKSQNDNGTSSAFSFTFENTVGIFDDEFSIGAQLDISVDKDINPPTTSIGTFMLKKIDFKGLPNKEMLTISGTDFGSAVLQDRIVEPTVFNSQEVSVIVKNLIDNYTTGLTYTGVEVTLTTPDYIQFKNITVWAAFQRLAKLSNSVFYFNGVDLQWHAKSKTSSGLTFDNTNTVKAKFKSTRNEIINQCWVYGDAQFTKRQNAFETAGPGDTGSVFTLDYKPHNTEVLVSDTTQKGGIWEMVTTPVSGVDYLMDYDLKKIIFLSGTALGDNIPPSGTGNTVIINYDIKSPIIKFADDAASIAAYGEKGKTIIDNTIQDPQIAADLVLKEVENNKDPKTEGDINLNGVIDVTPSQTCVCNFPYQNVNNEVLDIVEVNYDLTPDKMFYDEILRVKVNKRVRNIVDTINQMSLDLKALQAKELDPSDVLTRLKLATGSQGLKVKEWSIGTRGIGSDKIISHNINGLISSADLNQNVFIPSSGTRAYTIQVSGGD